MAVRGIVNLPKSNISVWWLLGLSVLTEAFEPQRTARTTRRIVSCETPESSATLRRDAFFSSTRRNTVGHSEEGIPSAGFLGPDCMIYFHHHLVSHPRHLVALDGFSKAWRRETR